MAAMITIEGIGNVLSSLGYLHENTLKSRLLVLVRNSYDNNTDASAIEDIDRDDLIRSLWGLGSDPETVKNKRRSFSSLKSSVNKDLRDLYKNGRNPEGITLGPHNIFALSNEAKDRILENLSNTIKSSETANLDKITNVLEVVNELLSDPNVLPDDRGTGTQDKLDQLKSILKSVSSTVGIAAPDGSSAREQNDSALPGQVPRASYPPLLETIEPPENAEEA